MLVDKVSSSGTFKEVRLQHCFEAVLVGDSPFHPDCSATKKAL